MSSFFFAIFHIFPLSSHLPFSFFILSFFSLVLYIGLSHFWSLSHSVPTSPLLLVTSSRFVFRTSFDSSRHTSLDRPVVPIAQVVPIADRKSTSTQQREPRQQPPPTVSKDKHNQKLGEASPPPNEEKTNLTTIEGSKGRHHHHRQREQGGKRHQGLIFMLPPLQVRMCLSAAIISLNFSLSLSQQGVSFLSASVGTENGSKLDRSARLIKLACTMPKSYSAASTSRPVEAILTRYHDSPHARSVTLSRLHHSDVGIQM